MSTYSTEIRERKGVALRSIECVVCLCSCRAAKVAALSSSPGAERSHLFACNYSDATFLVLPSTQESSRFYTNVSSTVGNPVFRLKPLGFPHIPPEGSTFAIWQIAKPDYGKRHIARHSIIMKKVYCQPQNDEDHPGGVVTVDA